ncbi:MAG: hypothetical protein AB7Q37_18855 [Pyrinomonadaceae bacterium]
MNEFVQHIAEVEGVKTPKRKRSKKEIETSFDDFTKERAAKKRSAKKSAASKPAAKKTAPNPDVKADRPAPTYADPIPMNFVSPDGYVREAAYDPKTKLFHVAFAKSTWAIPSNADEWKAFEKAIGDPDTNVDTYYRKAFRGRAGSMLAVREATNPEAAKAAPAKQEVSA